MRSGDQLGAAARDTFLTHSRGSNTCGSERINRPMGLAMKRMNSPAAGWRGSSRRVHLEAASLDLGGRDSHFTQGTLLQSLCRARQRPRRLPPGSRRGHSTNHGCGHDRIWQARARKFRLRHRSRTRQRDVCARRRRARRKRCVIGPWPGLTGEHLEGPGDFPVINNYRNVLAPILLRHARRPECASAHFPGV